MERCAAAVERESAELLRWFVRSRQELADGLFEQFSQSVPPALEWGLREHFMDIVASSAVAHLHDRPLLDPELRAARLGASALHGAGVPFDQVTGAATGLSSFLVSFLDLSSRSSAAKSPFLARTMGFLVQSLDASAKTFRALDSVDAVSPAEALRLDPAQVDLLVAAARGRSTAEIAEDLGVSRQTVGYRQGRLQQIFGARNRTHLVDLAHRAGVLR